MEPFRPIEANNNGQMVPQAESIWEGNYTNAAVARNAKQMLTAETRRRVFYHFNKLRRNLIQGHRFTEGKCG